MVCQMIPGRRLGQEKGGAAPEAHKASSFIAKMSRRSFSLIGSYRRPKFPKGHVSLAVCPLHEPPRIIIRNRVWAAQVGRGNGNRWRPPLRAFRTRTTWLNATKNGRQFKDAQVAPFVRDEGVAGSNP